ncbi:MAG: hypothetical protein EAY81_06765 [Bacteroidetes bacterium]|nr:MAG: hypothetical protein EAY81_06765 [Bacteroidota bacterium]
MKRLEFIKGSGLLGLSSLLPTQKLEAMTAKRTCVLIPTETAGPFPLDLSENTAFFRTDIRESKTGVQLNLKLKVIGNTNCLPLQNVRVNIWHCDKDGLYSGYSQTNNQGQAGLTYLRGYQFTDVNGEVNFTTILPGWYTGRICHIHFQVYVSSSYSAISQLTFDIPTKNAIYADNATIYAKGADPLTLNSDNIFADGYEYQIATLTPSTSNAGYDSYLEVTVQGSGATGIGHIEKETRKHFLLGQNYPNPFSTYTIIPFTLKQSGEVQLDVWNTAGKKLLTIRKGLLQPGDHEIKIDLSAYGLPVENYVYQLELSNSNGVYRDCKMMTASR